MSIDAKHPRRAARDPLKGAMPEARQSRFLGISERHPGSRGDACVGERWHQ